MRLTTSWLAVTIGSLAAAAAVAADLADPFNHWPTDLRIDGTVIVGSELRNVADLTGSLEALDLTSSAALLVDRDLSRDILRQYAAIFGGADEYRVVKRDPKLGFGELETLLPACQTFVWHSTDRLAQQDAQRLNRCSQQFNALLKRGGTLIFLGPAAECAAEHYVHVVDADVKISPGLGLFADCLFDLEDDEDAVRQRVSECLDNQPGTVGVSLAKGTLLRLSGRICSTSGSGTATFMLAAEENDSPIQSIKSRQSSRQSANDFLIDLTQWRRRAIDQMLEPFPPVEPRPPRVKNGTLLIVGGGGLPDGLMRDFVDLAGGVNDARLVYVPCSERRELSGEQATVQQWRNMGVKNATYIHTKDRYKANGDESFLAPLKEATGIWFGGGRQWNFADSYYGTKAQTLMKDVLTRGGVIGGSSAGASVQASFLARATPIGNFQILAPGYERGGLGFISGVAIDQHFSQRRRQKDMTQLVDRYPQMLGIGIDETTALIVNETVARVVGKGQVYFYDRNLRVPSSGPDYISLAAGSIYDLAKREVIERVETNSGTEETEE